jgi:hypothetical protein
MMKKRLFSLALPAVIVLFTQCSNPDGTDSFRNSSDDNDKMGPRRERSDDQNEVPDQDVYQDTMEHPQP